ncbi:hypothetical protein D3C76_1414340 [compost metagenome]
MSNAAEAGITDADVEAEDHLGLGANRQGDPRTADGLIWLFSAGNKDVRNGVIHLDLLKRTTESTETIPELEIVTSKVFATHRNRFLVLGQLVHAVADGFIGRYLGDFQLMADRLNPLPYGAV